MRERYQGLASQARRIWNECNSFRKKYIHNKIKELGPKAAAAHLLSSSSRYSLGISYSLQLNDLEVICSYIDEHLAEDEPNIKTYADILLRHLEGFDVATWVNMKTAIALHRDACVELKISLESSSSKTQHPDRVSVALVSYRDKSGRLISYRDRDDQMCESPLGPGGKVTFSRKRFASDRDAGNIAKNIKRNLVNPFIYELFDGEGK